MPYKKKTYKRKKRKYPVKRYNKSMFSQSPSYPIGKSFKFKTRYAEVQKELTLPAAGFPVHQVYTLNGLYDPDISGTGHSVLGFNQIMPLYDHYCVVGARARITFHNRDTTHAVLVAAHLQDNTNLSTDVNQIIENGMCKWTMLGLKGSGNSVKSMTMNCSPNKFFGNKVMQDEKYRGDISSNPADQVYLHITAQTEDAGTDSFQINYTIEIEYISVLTEPKQLLVS